jgi:hypothetical protein
LSDNEKQQAEELSELLFGLTLHPEQIDRWCWIPETSGLFSIKSCYYAFLRNRQIDELDPNVLKAINLLWRNDVPSKVLIFGWRLLFERLPTRMTLNHRGILLNPSDMPCVFCSLSHEDCAHLFYRCSFVVTVWEAVFNWYGKGLPTGAEGWNHFILFGDMIHSEKYERFKHLIWLAITWCLWKLRNNVIFNGANMSISSLLNDIKVISWTWVSGRHSIQSCNAFSLW